MPVADKQKEDTKREQARALRPGKAGDMGRME